MEVVCRVARRVFGEMRSGTMHSPRDRRMTKPVTRRPLRPSGVDGMGPAAVWRPCWTPKPLDLQGWKPCTAYELSDQF